LDVCNSWDFNMYHDWFVFIRKKDFLISKNQN